VRAVKGGRSLAQRTLDGDHRTRQSSVAECRHGAAFSIEINTPHVPCLTQSPRLYRFATMRTVLFLIAGKLDFTAVNPHARNPLQIQ
jgi:hypothetical protein